MSLQSLKLHYTIALMTQDSEFHRSYDTSIRKVTQTEKIIPFLLVEGHLKYDA
jgi:hypothetical protein